jgi:hypothetical protein
MPTAHEQFSEQFRRWELRGRGWQVFDGPVQPEPPFVPFNGHYLPATPVIDDGRRPTFLSSLYRKLTSPPAAPPVTPESEEEPEPISLNRDSLVELQVALPAELDIAKESFDQLFRNLALCHEPVTFELLGTHKRVLAQFVASAEDASLVRKQLTAHFPDVQFRQTSGALENAWDASAGDDAFAVEFGLENEFMLPLATGKLDPFIGIVGALAELQPGELALFQVLFQPVQNAWAESIVNSVSHADGKPFFINAPELAGAAENKTARPLFGVLVRIMARTASRDRLNEIARDLAGSLRVFANPQGNALIPLQNDDYPYLEHLEDVIARQSRRSGMILNSDELFSFVHLPSSAVRSPALLRDSGRTKAAPSIVRKPTDFVIGDNEHNGETVPVYLIADQRVRHTHIIGSSGTGKSSLLFNLIRQDIENGEGVGVLDPHGDLINQILGIIPDDRIDDVVLVDPSDVDFPIGFNILSAHSDDEKNLLASDLIAVFRRLSTSWGDQMDTVLQNAILAFLESRQGGTLSDLRLFLLDAKYRRQFLQTVADPEIIFYWQSVFPQLTGGKSIGPVLTRLQDFFSRKPLRNMVGQPQNKLDFADIMDSGKIFLARLPEGCGEENSYLLGTLLVSKFQQLAMARQSQQAAARRDFWLYIDEFDHFITPSMAKILSAVRKYRLGFTLAHQELHQLQSDPKVASAVLTQPCTRIVFKVGDDDAKKLGEGFESFDAKSLKNLPKFQAIARVERNDGDFNLTLRKPELPDEAEAQVQREKIIAASRAKYATPRAEVEAMLLARIWGDRPAPPPADDSGGTAAQKIPPAPPAPPPAVAQPPVNLNTPPVTKSVKIAEVPKPVPPPARLENLPTVAAAPAPVTGSEREKVETITGLPPVVARVPKSPVESSKVTVSEDKAPRVAGRGLAWHTTTQRRLKSEGQKLGFSSDAEKQLKKGSMQAADVMLRRGHLDIAVEIASTSSNVNHEFENVQKCLQAGFSRVAAVSGGRKFLDAWAAAILGALGPEAAAKVGYYTPDEFIDELRKLAAASEQPPAAEPMAAKDKRHGFVIERNFPKQTPAEQKATQQGIHEVVTRAIAGPP